MDQVNQPNVSSAPPDIPVKRKRGRPRKDQSLNHRGVAKRPPRFGVVNGNQSYQPNAIGNSNATMVGQEVRGVVDAAFDAGYLLTVQIGNSHARLRGVVFKPGHYVPISLENDVAPHVKMIQRNETPVPMNKQIRHRHRSKESNSVETGYPLNGSTRPNRTADLLASKGKHVLPVSTPSVPPVGTRGTVVPVVLEPVNISNGLPPGGQVQAPTGQVTPSQMQTSLQDESGGVPNENSPFHNGEEVKIMKQDGTSTQPAEDPILPPEGDDDMDEPLFVEPLRAIRVNQSHPGRMSELLQAVQENIRADKLPTVQNTVGEN